MAILRERDPRVGCLAAPITMIAGFVIGALAAAAFGAGAGASTLAGAVLAVVAMGVAVVIVVRSGP